MKQAIVLIGFSATGKSTVGRLLAARLGWALVDTDAAIIEQTGKSIGEIFHGEGEEVFRRHEQRILRRSARQHRVVIASGGGAVLVAANRELMARSCFIVCLEARPETIYARLALDLQAGVNPIAKLLTAGDDAIERIAYLKQFRQPYYAIADWTVHTDHLSPEDVTEEATHGWHFYEQTHRAAPDESAPSTLHYPLGDARESDAPYGS